MTKDRFLACFALAALFMSGAWPAAAHDPRASAIGSTAVTFSFSDGTPMAFAAARIFGPSDAIPYAEATTDRAGRIYFLPDRGGLWRAEATDQEGHRFGITVSIDGGVPVGSGKGVPDGLVAGSIVLNLIFLSVFARRLRRKGVAQ